jgi:hypothetical protein
LFSTISFSAKILFSSSTIVSIGVIVVAAAAVVVVVVVVVVLSGDIEGAVDAIGDDEGSSEGDFRTSNGVKEVREVDSEGGGKEEEDAEEEEEEKGEEWDGIDPRIVVVVVITADDTEVDGIEGTSSGVVDDVVVVVGVAVAVIVTGTGADTDICVEEGVVVSGTGIDEVEVDIVTEGFGGAVVVIVVEIELTFDDSELVKSEDKGVDKDVSFAFRCCRM